MHFSVGDVVVRIDIKGRKRYRIERIASDGSGWIYARPVGGGKIVTFPSQFMLKKVEVAGGGELRLKDKSRGSVALRLRDGVVVGATGSEPGRFMGLTEAEARYLARHGAPEKKSPAQLDREIAAMARRG